MVCHRIYFIIFQIPLLQPFGQRFTGSFIRFLSKIHRSNQIALPIIL